MLLPPPISQIAPDQFVLYYLDTWIVLSKPDQDETDILIADMIQKP